MSIKIADPQHADLYLNVGAQGEVLLQQQQLEQPDEQPLQQQKADKEGLMSDLCNLKGQYTQQQSEHEEWRGSDDGGLLLCSGDKVEHLRQLQEGLSWQQRQQQDCLKQKALIIRRWHEQQVLHKQYNIMIQLQDRAPSTIHLAQSSKKARIMHQRQPPALQHISLPSLPTTPLSILAVNTSFTPPSPPVNVQLSAAMNSNTASLGTVLPPSTQVPSEVAELALVDSNHGLSFAERGATVLAEFLNHGNEFQQRQKHILDCAQAIAGSNR